MTFTQKLVFGALGALFVQTAISAPKLPALPKETEYTVVPETAGKTFTDDGVGVVIGIIAEFPVRYTKDKKPYRSMMFMPEFNCTTEKYRIVGYMLYTNKPGEGTPVLKVTKPSEWAPIEEESKAAELASSLCRIALKSGEKII